MSHICQYCKNAFSAKRNLDRHQTTAEYCLDLQKSLGLMVKKDEYKCECGRVFNLKHHLKRHEEFCSSNTSPSMINNGMINSSITINQINNITINPVKRFTMRDLTREYILARLTPVITKEIVKSGMGAITELIVEVLLQKDGKYCYYCSDKSRKKFTMVIDHEGQVVEEKDPNAQCLRSILSIPLEAIVSEIVDKHSTKASLETYEEVVDLKRDGACFGTTLASTLPCDADGIPEIMKARIEEETSDVVSIKLLGDRHRSIKIRELKKKVAADCPYIQK